MAFFFLLITILLLPLAHLKTIFFGYPLYLPEIAILCASGAFLYARKKETFSLPDRWVLFGIGLFLFGSFLSYFTNPATLTGLGMLKSWFLFPALFGYLLWSEIKTTQQREKLLLVWLLVILLVALRSLFLFVSGEQTYDGRLAGDYTSPNFLAFFLAPGILLTLFFLLAAIEEKKMKRGMVLGICLAVFFSALFFTHSYGAWLGIFGALLVFFFSRWHRGGTWKKELVVIALVFCVAGLFFVLDQGSGKWQALLNQDPRSSFSSRVMIWQAAFKIVADHPVLGIGVGRFQDVYLEYQVYFSPYLEWAVPQPHNIFLAIFLATGIIGFFGFLFFLSRLVLLLVRNIFISGETKERPVAVLMLSLWALFLLYGIFDTPYFKNDLAYLFFLMVALSLFSKTK